MLETIDISRLTEGLYAKVITLADRCWQLESVGRGSIVIDCQRITEAILNLAQNAAQHTQVGDTIAIGSALRGDRAYFWV